MDESLVVLRDALLAASDKVRHPALSLDYFVSARCPDVLSDDEAISLAGVPDVEVKAARIRRGSVMVAAEQVIDQCIDDLQQVTFDDKGFPAGERAEGSFVYREFPGRHRRAYNQAFYRKVLVTAIKVAHDLADPRGADAGCTAEEIIRAALGPIATGLCRLVELDEPDIHLEDALLEDFDFEYLFDDEMDGIEDDPARQAAWGMTVPGVRDWFSPFNERSVVHPYAETAPSARPVMYNLLNRIAKSDDHRQVLDSPAIDARDPISSLAACSEAVALARAATTPGEDLLVWVPDEHAPDRSYDALVTALAQAPRGSGWLTWEPHENADVVRTEPVVSATAHRHFPVGRDEPWLWAAVGGGRMLAIPLAAVVSYQPDPDVWHTWEHRFDTPGHPAE